MNYPGSAALISSNMKMRRKNSLNSVSNSNYNSNYNYNYMSRRESINMIINNSKIGSNGNSSNTNGNGINSNNNTYVLNSKPNNINNTIYNHNINRKISVDGLSTRSSSFSSCDPYKFKFNNNNNNNEFDINQIEEVPFSFNSITNPNIINTNNNENTINSSITGIINKMKLRLSKFNNLNNFKFEGTNNTSNFLLNNKREYNQYNEFLSYNNSNKNSNSHSHNEYSRLVLDKSKILINEYEINPLSIENNNNTKTNKSNNINLKDDFILVIRKDILY